MTEYDVEVRLLAVTKLTGDSKIPSSRLKIPSIGSSDAEALIEYAGRLCWDTHLTKTGSVPNRIQGWIEVGHESMIEHASATFYIRCSRVVTHELVRHRIGSYSQRSQRYVRENEPRYITPAEFMADIPPTSRKVMGLATFEEATKFAWQIYRELLQQGWAPELARYVLPGGCETQIICTWNFRELRHIIRLRTGPRALPEMRVVAGKIREICKEIAPQVFEDL